MMDKLIQWYTKYENTPSLNYTGLCLSDLEHALQGLQEMKRVVEADSRFQKEASAWADFHKEKFLEQILYLFLEYDIEIEDLIKQNNESLILERD